LSSVTLAVCEVLDTGATVTDVTTHYGIDRRTLDRWLVRYSNEGLPSIRRSQARRLLHQIAPNRGAL
jgi:transposase-like protein